MSKRREPVGMHSSELEHAMGASHEFPKVEDGCACHYHPGPVMGMPDDVEYEPACPVHSEHLYDPRSGSWIFRDPEKRAEWEADRADEAKF